MPAGMRRLSTPTVHVETQGRGDDLVLLHGWGLHGGLFSTVREQLAEHFLLHIIDLPGHGYSTMPDGEYSLQSIARSIAETIPAQAHWLGWSLGGRVALQAAADDLFSGKLILVGANPCFTQKPDWPHAMPEAELEAFAASLQENYRPTLQRFIALQSRGSEHGREELRTLREQLFSHGEPQIEALRQGLELLRAADLRPLLANIKKPVLIIHGERDTLAPLAAAEYTASQLTNGLLRSMEGAGHAPFISHPDEFSATVQAFLSGNH